MQRPILLFVCLVLLCSRGLLCQEKTHAPVPISPVDATSLAVTPPMGWNRRTCSPRGNPSVT